ncbi:MAG: ComEC/Rec2 family competence protein [Clostridia bacterium]|nr:ComEC/Rec2 family competence protein [Clostridia bacterium]
MIDYLRKRPMLISAVGCVISAVCGFYSFWALALCLLLFAVFLIFSLFKKQAVFTVVWILLVVMCISCFSNLKKAEKLESMADSNINAYISFESTTYKSEGFYRSTFEVVKSETLPKGTKISLWHTPLNFSLGDILYAQISLSELDEDYKASNFGNKIYISGNIEEFKKLDTTDNISKAVNKIRNYVAKTVFENMSKESAATVCALVSGDRSYLEDRFYDNIKASGVAHVMVVSGMHLSIIVSLILKIIEKTVYKPYFKAFIMFCTVIIMCAVCGFTNSILRAGITYIIMALGLLLNRPYSGENALGGAVTFILISSPFTVFNIGFQLSVLSTLGILAVALPICKHLDINKKIPKYIIETTILSLSAMLLTLPITIYVFGYVSNMSVFTNLLISFPVTIILSASVVALILSIIFPFMASVLLGFVDYGVKYINSVINYLGTRSFAVTRLPPFVSYVAVLVILVVFEVLLTCKKRQDMLKLKEMNEKILKEGGNWRKWQSFLKTH